MRHAALTRSAILVLAAVSALVSLVLFKQRTRTIEGTWIDLFEGSRFFEGQDISQGCSPAFMDAPWLAYYPQEQSAAGKLLKANRNSGVFVSKYGSWPVAAYRVKFEGYHRVFGLGFRHLGASPSEYVVDRMISIEPVRSPNCDIRPDLGRRVGVEQC